MDYFEKLDHLLAFMKEFADAKIEQSTTPAIYQDIFGGELFESFVENESCNWEASQGNVPQVEWVECFQIKKNPLKAILYDKCPIQSSKDEDKSGQACFRTCSKENSQSQKWLKQVCNELSWVGIYIYQLDDNIEQFIKEGKQSLADMKLILKMTSRLILIFQLIFQQNNHSAKDQESFRKAQETCKKYTDFLIQAFQEQSQIRSSSLSKEQQGKYLRKALNNEQFRTACKILNINVDNKEDDKDEDDKSSYIINGELNYLSES